MELLQRINSPADLRRLRPEQLQEVANEIRQYILETMSRIGGHTGASLGAVELAVALHYAFDTPRDRLVWDVGHQAYAHKILTGRRQAMAKPVHIRKQPPSEARPATVWPAKPRASPVWRPRTQVRSFRPGLAPL